MHYLSLIYFVNQPKHVSGVFIVHHQEILTLYVHPDPASSQSTETYNTYQLLYIYSKYLLMIGNKYARNM
jgi:hypothetical protein